MQTLEGGEAITFGEINQDRIDTAGFSCFLDMNNEFRVSAD